jgi:hypothetical protein
MFAVGLKFCLRHARIFSTSSRSGSPEKREEEEEGEREREREKGSKEANRKRKGEGKAERWRAVDGGSAKAQPRRGPRERRKKGRATPHR